MALHKGSRIKYELVSEIDASRKNNLKNKKKTEVRRRALLVIRFPLQIAVQSFKGFPLNCLVTLKVAGARHISAIRRQCNFPKCLFETDSETKADNSGYVGRIISEMCCIVCL